MGFDSSNILNPYKIRVNNYYDSKEKHISQKESILLAIALLKSATPSKLYNYFNSTNGNKEKYPITSIRARINELVKLNKLQFAGEMKSENYDSTEASYRVKQFEKGLF